MTDVTEIAPDVFRISAFVPEINMQFNQFFVRDEEPLRWRTGLKAPTELNLYPVQRQ